MSEPTLAELVRRLEDVARQLGNLAVKLDDDRRLAAQTYVNRETYQADQRVTDTRLNSIVKDVDELDQARKNDQGWRRQSSFTLAIACGGWLVTIALAVLALLMR